MHSYLSYHLKTLQSRLAPLGPLAFPLKTAQQTQTQLSRLHSLLTTFTDYLTTTVLQGFTARYP